jgi:signal transduction histidine kinase/CheY-like chemotaxis protein
VTKPQLDSRATIIATCVGLTLSFGLANIVARWDRQAQLDTFKNMSSDRVAVFGWKLGETLGAFTSLSAFFAASQEVEPAEFKAFAERLLQAQPTIAAIAWLPRVARGRLDEFRNGLQALAPFDADENSRLCDATAAAELPDHYPVAQVVPAAGHEGLLGVDCASHVECTAAVRRSLVSGEFSVSARVTLPVDANYEQRIAALSPIYPNGTPSRAIRLGVVKPLGFVAVLFDVQTVWEHGVAHLRPAGIDIDVRDVTEAGTPTLLYHRSSHLGPPSPSRAQPWRGRSFEPNEFRDEFGLPIGGRRWSVTAAASPRFVVANASSRSSIALLGGLIVTALVAIHLFVRARQTEALLRTNDRLRAAREDIEVKESQLRRIIDLVPHLIFVRDHQGNVLLANRATADACGTSIGELINGERRAEHAARLDALGSPEQDREITAHQRPAHDCDVELFDARGRKRRLDATKIPYTLPGSHTPAVLCVAVDETELRAAEADKARLESELRHSQKMESIGLLAGGIAHDFNNLLGAIIGNTELALDKTPAGDPMLENLNEVLDASEHASNLVAQILTFSRKDELELTALSPAEVVTGALELMRGSIPSRIELVREIDERTGAILGDRTQLAQVVMNLCSNACQAIGDRGGRVTVQLGRVQVSAREAHLHPGLHPGPYVLLRVGDDGCGMSADTRERIFDPFFTTKGVGTGTGLGLSVVHGIVATHRGVITVDTKTGSGTTFGIYLPEIDVAACSASAPDRSVVTGNGRILLVDDDVALLRTAGEMLEMLGYDVETAATASDALAALRADPDGFEAVITDQAMPMMTGVELAREIRALRPLLPVILVTGFSDEVTQYNAASHGLSGFLTKPYRSSDLGTALQVVLGLRLGVEA